MSFGTTSAAGVNPAGLHKVVLAPDGAIVGYSWGGKRLAFRILPNSQIARRRLILLSGRAIAFNLRGRSAISTNRGGEYRLILLPDGTSRGPLSPTRAESELPPPHTC
jgi:hypothetical protein